MKHLQMSVMKKIKLGNQGLETPVEGLGCMGMTSLAGMTVYNPSNESDAIATIHRALEIGVNEPSQEAILHLQNSIMQCVAEKDLIGKAFNKARKAVRKRTAKIKTSTLKSSESTSTEQAS